MFDVGFDEMLLVAIVAIIVIGPKDLPMALRTAGRWLGKIRRVSGHFRSGVENMIREAELEEMEKKWREQNAEIMAAHPDPDPDAEAKASAEASQGLSIDAPESLIAETKAQVAPELPLAPPSKVG